RLHIIITHLAIHGVGHHGEESAAVLVDTFADGADLFAISPVAEAGFGIWSEIGRDYRAGQACEEIGQDVAAPPPGRDDGASDEGEIALRVAAVAVGQVLEEEFAASDPLGGHGHFDISGGDLRGRAEVEVGETYSGDENEQQQENQQDLFHHDGD